MANDNFEIERKFLIAYPGPDILDMADISDIVQTYLKRTADGFSARLRKRGRDGNFVYTYTEKKHISDIRRIENEKEISQVEYEKKLSLADPARHTIYKKRCCLEYRGQIFEIDLYDFWNDRATMELELNSENQRIYFPPFIDIICELTDDRRYTNSSLAIEVPYDDIETLRTRQRLNLRKEDEK